MEGFIACPQPCLAGGRNAVWAFPGGTTKIYLQWSYANIPRGAHYTRTWTMDGLEWVQYDCTWPGPENGVDSVTLTEPDGLHSGTWEVTVRVDGTILMQEQIQVQGNWTYWVPAGRFDTCYGKK